MAAPVTIDELDPAGTLSPTAAIPVYQNGDTFRTTPVDIAGADTSVAVLATLAASNGSTLVGFAQSSSGLSAATVHGAIEEIVSDLSVSSGSSSVGFLQAGTGAVPRELQAKSRERKSLEDFGAVGDGVTDDATAWATALAAMGSANFELHGTPGATYLIGAAGIAISNKTSARIVGDGAKIKVNAVSTQSPSDLTSTVIFLDTNTNVEFSGWDLDGNSKASNLLGMKGNTECVVQHNRFSTGGLLGQVFALNNTRCKYLDNKCISGSGTARGLWIGNYGASLMENDCEIAGNIVRSMGATGIVCASVGGRIYGNHCESNSGSGIIFGGAAGFSSKKLAISGNVCRANTFMGIQSDVSYTSDADLPYDIVISGNLCELNNSSGIYAIPLDNSTIVGNICRDNNADASGSGDGIQLDEARGLVVAGNYCYDSRTGGSRTQSRGIRVEAQANRYGIKNVTISGNIIYNNSGAGLDVQAIGATDSIDNLVITGNVSASNGGRGIIVAEGAAGIVNRLVVTNNVFQGNTTNDIRVDALDAVIDGNLYSTESGAQYYSFTSTDTTPSVKGGRKTFRANNASATTITTFDDGVNGQEIEVMFNNRNTTIAHGTIQLAGYQNVTPDTNTSMRFRRLDAVWRETGRTVENVAVAFRATTAVGNVGTGEDTLQSITVLANTLYVNGRGVRITAWGTKANNADTKTLKLHFGSVAILTHALGTSAAGSWKITAEVLRTASNAQDYNAFLIGTDTDAEIGTATQTDTATIVVKCTGEATSNNDIVQEGLIVEVINA